MKSILDPTFRYTPSIGTDIRRAFARIRREQRAIASSEAVASRKRVDVSRSVVVMSPRRQAISVGPR